MDDRDFKINLAFHEYCSILNDTSLCFSYSGEIDRDFRFFSSIYRWKDTGGDRVENYEKIVRCFIERVEIREKEKFFLLRFFEKIEWKIDDRVKINKASFKMELMERWKFVLLLNWWKFELNVSIPKNKLNLFSFLVYRWIEDGGSQRTG